MQKLDGVEDLRVRRTRKLLTQALIEGTVEKGFAALTVRDITRRAMVNRSTFYRHYLDKYDLLEQHLNEIYEVLEEGGIIGEGRPEGNIDEEIIELFKQIQQFPDFYRVMLGPQADAFLSQRFIARRIRAANYLIQLENRGGFQNLLDARRVVDSRQLHQ